MNIKKQIARKGLKHNWIAQKVGISSTYLSKIINGKRSPRNKNLLRKIRNAIS